MTVVIDTDVFSFFLKGDTRIEPYLNPLSGETICLSFQTVAELYQWAELRKWGEARRRTLDAQLASFVILPYDDLTGRTWARVRAERQRIGRPMSSQDAWIAACSIRHNCTLVTHNTADFTNISGLRLLHIDR